MADFNGIIFNPEVFDAYQDALSGFDKNALLASGAIVPNNKYLSLMSEQVGSYYVTTPIKAPIGGATDNYDGKTDINTHQRGTYSQGRVVIGRSYGFEADDFATDITGGEDFMAVAGELADFWDNERQKTVLKILDGVFTMTGGVNDDFIDSHTYSEPVFNEVTLNNAVQKAVGDNKNAFSVMICHSRVATNLENRNLINYAKYTDPNGIEREVQIGTLNGRPVLIDDGMPVEMRDAEYRKATPFTEGALKVVDTGAEDGEVEQSAVLGDIDDVQVGDYVVYMPAGLEYTTYVLGAGAIEYTNVGAKVPSELDRDPATRGGVDKLYTRQRFCFAPKGISYTDSSNYSPSDDDLANGENWSVAQDGKGQENYPLKGILMTQIKTRG